MQKFRARVKEVEAIQWFPPGHPKHIEIPAVTVGYPLRKIDGVWKGDTRCPATYYLNDIELHEGFWIVYHEGEAVEILYPDYFAEKYEEVQ